MQSHRNSQNSAVKQARIFIHHENLGTSTQIFLHDPADSLSEDIRKQCRAKYEAIPIWAYLSISSFIWILLVKSSPLHISSFLLTKSTQLEKFFLTAYMNFLPCNFNLSVLVLVSGAIGHVHSSSVWQPFKYLKRAITSSVSYLFSRLKIDIPFTRFPPSAWFPDPFLLWQPFSALASILIVLFKLNYPELDTIFLTWLWKNHWGRYLALV